MPKEVLETTLLTIKEISELLDLSIRTVTNYVMTGKIRGRKIGQKWYVTENNLKIYLNGY